MNKKNVCKTILFALLLTVLLGLCVGAMAQTVEECTSTYHVGPIVQVNIVPATCTVNGSVQKKCQNCGVIIATEPIIAQGHQLQSRTTTITAPTCTASGMMQVTVKCSVCGYLDSVTNEAIPALGHQLGTPVTIQAATCEGTGISRKSCIRGCGYYEDTTLPALGHNLGGTVTISSPTCTEPGVRRKTCTRCDYYEEQSVPAPGHDLQNRTNIIRMAACTENGVQQVVKTCRACGYMDSVTNEELPALGHQWNGGVITKQPTETEDGIRTYTCLRNSAHTMTEAIPALGGNPSGPDDSGFTVENGLITGYTGASTELVIPSEINGVAITGVDEFAFEDNTALTSVSLPSSVVSIGDYAFSGCSGLSEITLPSGLTSIGNCVFKGCSSLNNLGIPSGVTSIGSSAFKDCASLTEINLPNNLTSIGSHAFEGCIGLTEIAVPNTVTSLGSYAFTQCTGLTSATLPTGLTSLANGLFNGCILLKSIDIPAGVTSIGYYAFNGCSGLTSVTIPRGVTSIAYSAFDSCTGLSSIEIPDTVTDIGIFAFFNCTNLTSAVIPASVTSIGSQAFGGCSGLTDVYYTGSSEQWPLVSIGSNNESLLNAEIHYNSVAPQPGVVASGSCGTNVDWTLYSSGLLTVSGTGAMKNYSLFSAPWFSNRTTIKTVQIENGVTSVGDHAFDGCSNLTDVTIPGSVTRIGDYAFDSCSNLTSAAIPSGVTTIGTHAFYKCSSLPGVTIPSSVTTIGSWAFSGCSGMTSVTVASSSNAVAIETGAFSDCTGLTSVTLPSGVGSIRNNAFYGCTSLTSVTIPSSVFAIDFGAFADCSKLESIQVERGSMSYASVNGVLFNKNRTTLLAYPGGKTGAYAIPSGVTSIMTQAFYGCTGLTSVTIPSSVTTIGDTTIGDIAFSACSSLESIQVESGNTTYASVNGVLFNKAKTTLITCPGKKTGAYAIPSGVTTIESEAFCECSSLTSVNIPNSVTSIGDGAFYDCSSLTDVYYTGSREQWAAISIESHNEPLINAEIHYDSVGTGAEVIASGSCGANVDWTLDDTGLLTISGTGTIDHSSSGGNPWYSNRAAIKTVQIKNGVTAIGNNAFNGCSNLTSVTIPDSVATIGDSAFYGCSSLPSVTIPDTVTSIGQRAFDSCSGLTGVILSQNLASIEAYAFCSCTGLTGVILPSSLTSIGEAAFSASGLTSVTIPGSVTSIGDVAFDECGSLTSVTLSNGVTSIGLGSFGNSGLTSVTIPDSVTSIGAYAFNYCASLTSAMIPASVTSIGQDAFDGCDQLIITGIIDSCANAYANENNIPFVGLPACNHEWGKPTATLSPTKTEKGSAERFCILCGEKDVMEIPALNDMNTLYLPAGLTAIEEYAFSLLTADALIVPDSCTTIEENAFMGSCFIYIRVPAGITIPETAFDGCFGHLVVDTGE